MGVVRMRCEVRSRVIEYTLASRSIRDVLFVVLFVLNDIPF